MSELELLPKPVVFVDASASIDDTLRVMIKKRVSSVLVKAEGLVCGIVTERDIIRKIVLLEIDRKYEHKINTVMSRTVEFVRHDHIYEDVIKLHFEKKRRHFPVLNGPTPKVEAIVGMLTVTDICRKFLDGLKCP
jgi:CBS domain-containing protein